MKTLIRQENNHTVLEVSGYLNFESARPFAKNLADLMSSQPTQTVVVNLSGLQFVGSSGISDFVKQLRSFNSMKIKPRYCGMSPEFRRLFHLFESQDSFDIYDDVPSALTTVRRKLVDRPG